MRVVLDSNAYDKLAVSSRVQSIIRDLIRVGTLTVIATRCLWEEIEGSPHKDLALSLPLTLVGESVMFVNGGVDDRIGSGELYEAHLGASRQHNDALIADAAQFDADFLVSEDKRLRRRMAAYSNRCRPITFEEFEELLTLRDAYGSSL